MKPSEPSRNWNTAIKRKPLKRHISAAEFDAREAELALANQRRLREEFYARQGRRYCPHEGCPGLELHNGKPDGCGHPTITSGCRGERG